MRLLGNLVLLCLILTMAANISGCSVKTDNGVNDSDNNVLRVGVSTNSPPLIYREGSAITGLEADFAKQFGVFIGKDVKFIPVTWDKQLDYLTSGKTDIIMSGMTVTNKRAYRVAFTTPYLQSGQLIVTQLKNKNKFSKGIYSLMNSKDRIGTVKNTTGDFLITKSISNPKRKQFTHSKDAIKALIAEEIDVFVYDAPMACYYAAMNENNNITVNLNLLSQEYLAWAVSKQNPLLLEQANNFLKEMEENGKIKATIKRWIPYM